MSLWSEQVFKNKNKIWQVVGCILISVLSDLGCEDSTTVPTSEVDFSILEPDQELPLQDQGPPLVMMDHGPIEVDSEIDQRQVGWIQLKLSPTRSYYTLRDMAEASVEVFDQFGEPFPEALVSYQMEPILADLSVDQQGIELGQYSDHHRVSLSFISEGFSDVVACATTFMALEQDPQGTDTKCARRPILVDDSGPAITVDWPPRGESLSYGDRWPSWEEIYPDEEPPVELFGGELESIPEDLSTYLPVYGRVYGLGTNGTLTLNGHDIESDDRGYFTAFIESKSGYREISVTADDGVRFQLEQDRRWVLLAADYIPHEENLSTVTEGVSFTLHQNFIDGDAPSIGEGEWVSTEIAQLLDLFLGLIDPGALISSSSLINTAELRLSINDLDLGTPDIDLIITERGLSLLISLNQVIVEVDGRILIGQSEIDLSGALEVSLSAFSDYELSIRESVQPIGVNFIDGGVAITRITPQLNEEAANAVISVVESTARGLIVEQIEAQVLGLVERDIPALLEGAVRDVFSQIRSIPLALSTNIGDDPPLELNLQVQPRALSTSMGLAATVSADLVIENRSDPSSLIHQEARGIPRLTQEVSSVESQEPVSLKLRPEAVNALLAEIWRSGLLELAPPLPMSASFFFSGVKASALSTPIMTVSRGLEPYPIYLELGALSLELTQAMTGAIDHYEAFLRVGAELVVQGGSVSIRLEELPLAEVALVSLGGERPVVTEDLIANLLVNQVWPSLSAELLSRLNIGIPDSPLRLSELSYLGLEIDQGWVRPQFDQLLDYREDLITISGRFLFDFQQ